MMDSRRLETTWQAAVGSGRGVTSAPHPDRIGMTARASWVARVSNLRLWGLALLLIGLLVIIA